jgi:hypothetical protein
MQAFLEMQQKGRIERKIVNTKNILFIVSGAFTGLDEIIRKRLNTSRIGFQREELKTDDPTQIFDFATTQDFIEFGYEPEFVGRLPVRVSCHQLSVDDLYSILKESKGSIIRQYIQSFKAYGIEVCFRDDALYAIASKAHEQKTGARALMTVMESIFRDFKFELPSRGIEKFEITANTILNPEADLSALLSNYPELVPPGLLRSIQSYENDFFAKHQMRLRFSTDGMKYLAQLSNNEGFDLVQYLNLSLQSYEHGLKLIQQNSGVSEFEITTEVLQDPRSTLERWIRLSYLKPESKEEAQHLS